MSRDSGQHRPPNRARTGVPHLLLAKKLARHQARPMNSLQGRAVLSEATQGLLEDGGPQFPVLCKARVFSFLFDSVSYSMAF